MCITVTPFTAAHIEAVSELEALCFSDPWSADALAEELANPCARFLVALDGGTVVGYLGCHHIAGEGFIANVAVHPNHRRRGIALKLVATAIEQGASLSRLTLEVRESNTTAIALYRSLGFVKDGVRPRFYTHPTEDAGIYSYYFPKSEVTPC